MASLLSWGFDKLKGGAQTLNRDILNPTEHAAGNVIHAGGNVVHAVEAAPTVVNRDVVRPVAQRANAAVAQVNPFDNGRTYNTVMQRGSLFTPHPNQSLLFQATHNGLTNVAGDLFRPPADLVKGTADAAYHLAATPVETARAVAAEITNNPSATNAAIQREKANLQNTMGVLQSVPRFAYGLGESLNPTGGDVYKRTHVPTGIQKVILGNQPIPSWQAQYKQTAAQHGKVRAGSEAVLNSIMAALPAAKVVPKVEEIAPTIARTTVKGAKASTPTATLHRTLLEKNPSYAALQQRLDGSTAAANKINQNGGSKIALNQHLKNIADIQQQMAEMRRKASAKGSLNPDYSSITPEGNSLPKRTSANPRLPKTQSSASKETLNASSKSSVAPKPSTTISAVKTSNGGAVSASEVASVADGKGRSSVGTPSKPLQQVSHAPNLKSDLQAQSDLRIVEQNPAQLQEQSQVGVGEQRLVKNPSSNSTPRRGFIQSVNKSGEVSPIVAKRASGTYKVRDTKKLAQSADKFASGNISKATEAVSSSLAKKRGAISDREVANAIAVAKRHDANHNYAQATDIYENLSKHLTAQGQSIQAASLLDRRTPEGIRYAITKEFKKHNITPSKETLDAIESKMGEIKKTKPGTPERILATKQLQKIVADQLPSNLADKGVAFWKAGLLTGARTQSGNLLSNETFSVLHNISNPLAAGLDKGISLVTGRRTKTLTGKGLVSGTNEGFKRGATYLKTGIDERAQLTNKFDSHQVNFKNKALNTYVNGVFRLMGAADRPHYYRQLQNSLADLATADGKNLRLKGQALRDHVNNFVKNPPQEAFQVATNEAEKSVLANDTILSKAISKVREVSENAESPLGKAATEAAINLLMPFTRVPSAFISRVVDYTPVGAIKTIAGQISRGKFNQRDLVTAISEAGTGTGLMYLGAKLAENNMLSGDYPSEPKEQQRWKAEGIQPNSIKVAGKWINMNYAGPLGLLFGAGARIADTKSQGGSFLQQQAQAYAGLPKDLTQQSFLQGLSGAMQAINEPGQYLNNYEKSQAGSIIPTLIGDVATATDSKQRQADNPLQTIKSRIPGVRETLNPAQDIYGNPLPRKTGPLSSMINPLRPTTDMSNKNPVVKEVNRLHNVDPNNSDLQVTPIPVPRTLRVKGNPVHLSSQQRYDLQKQVGQTIQSNWSKLISTPEYKALSDIDKAKALSNLRTDSTTLATRTFVTANNLATYNKAASSKVIALDHGTADMSNYTASAPGGSGSLVINKGLDPQSRTTLTQYKNTADRTKAFNSTPAAEYQYDQAKYQNDLANGTMTPAKKIRTQKTLQREKVGSTYPKNVRDLYSLSNAELYDYLTTSEKGVDKAKTAKQLIAYDQALYNAGIEKHLKFKTGIAPSSGGSGSRSSKYDKVATANLKFALAQKPLKIVGALPAPSKTTGPKFITPALKTVYQKKAVNTHPTVSVTKTKHP